MKCYNLELLVSAARQNINRYELLTDPRALKEAREALNKISEELELRGLPNK